MCRYSVEIGRLSGTRDGLNSTGTSGQTNPLFTHYSGPKT